MENISGLPTHTASIGQGTFSRAARRRIPQPRYRSLFVLAALILAGCGDRLLIDDPRQLNIQVAAPVFNVPAGNYSGDIRVALSCPTEGAEIHYTIDGSAPSEGSARFSGADPLLVSGNGTVKTIRAVAVKKRLRDSPVVSATYSVNYAALNIPRFNPIEGSYSSDQSVTIACEDPGAVIHYTSDGSIPTAASPVFSAPIPISGDGSAITLIAIACRPGMLDSSPVSASYRIDYSQTSSPNFDPPGGYYTAGKSVSITCDTAGAVIRYTVDGSDPTSSSPLYSGPVSVSGDRTVTTLKAVAYTAGMRDSTVSSATYTIEFPVPAPTISPGSCSALKPLSLTIAQTRPGAAIYYTTDGTDPRGSATRVAYSGAFTLPRRPETTTTVKAVAVLGGWSDSPVAEESYAFPPPKIYVGLSTGVLVSEDKGASWADAGLPSGTNVFVVKGSAGMVYVGSSAGLYRMAEGGAWALDTGAGTNIWAMTVIPENDGEGRHIKDHIYAAPIGGNITSRVYDVRTGSWENGWTNLVARANYDSSIVYGLFVEGTDIYLATTAGLWKASASSGTCALLSSGNFRSVGRLGRFLIAGTAAGIVSSTNGTAWTTNQFINGGSASNIVGVVPYVSVVGGRAFAGTYTGSDEGGATPQWYFLASWLGAEPREPSSPRTSFTGAVGSACYVDDIGIFFAGGGVTTGSTASGGLVSMRLSGQDWYVGGTGFTSENTNTVKGVAAP